LAAAAALVIPGLILAAMATPGAQASPVPGAPSDNPDPSLTVEPFVDDGRSDFDRRAGNVGPTASQLQAVRGMDATARWNSFGTPQSLINHGGYLATGLSADAVTAARSWLRQNRGLFRLSQAEVDGLELVSDQRMAQSAGHAVLFRQRFGGLPAAVDGMVVVGVVSGKVAYVSSSIAGASDARGAADLNAVQGWLQAAANAGRVVPASAVTDVHQERGWTVFAVDGFSQVQRARLRALPSPDGNTRTVWEANVVDVGDGDTLGFTSFVDASSGRVLVRHGQVDDLFAAASEYTDTFTGAFTAADPCGPRHPFVVDDQTETIIYSATANNPVNDITIKLYDPSNEVVSSQDTGFSPEAQTYTGPIVAGAYKVEVCAFEGADPIVTGDYTGTFTASEQEASGIAYPPKWNYFLANPPLNFAADHTRDNRSLGCWESIIGGTKIAECDNPPSDLINLAARGPWDFNFRTQTPTFTTEGNAAVTAEAWANPPTIVFGNLTPGAFGQRPFEEDREYDQPFEDVWNNQKCNPAVLTPGGNDILASVTHLFASHNRFHDYSYFLGFTEANYNLQDSNFGNQGAPLDPEVGNVQSGALTGGPPLFGGRDNANQITLQDGIPGITNQYLFQPIAGAFYAPCVDGDFDLGVVGHEYTHATSNRMVGGPDSGLSGFQAGSMGESWSDQVAAEYLLAHNYKPGVSPFVEGAYVTGNKKTGIRNYRLDRNPLQYGDLGYDFTGPEVHADGEPWSAVNIDIRQAMIAKYNSRFPASDNRLQRLCAQGDTFASPPSEPRPAQRCPGNRRWIQLVFDSFLLQSPATSMLDARDAMLAADRMRFGGDNQALLWREFANNGFGQFADTAGTEDDEPTPDYTSPFANEGTLRITANALDQPGQPAVDGTLYLGRYEARVTPVADTDNSTPLPRQLRLVPGTYEFVFQADGYGLNRFRQTIGAGQIVDRQVHLSTNLASVSSGATIDGATPGSINTTKLIDDTEATNYVADDQVAGVQVTKPVVNVDLAGGKQLVRSVKVSAMLRPPNPAQDESEEQPDMSSNSRFTALRQFAIETCTQSSTSDCSSILPGDTTGSPYTRIYTSPDNAFPSIIPRPLVPDLLFERFDVPDTQATHVRLVTLENQCTGTPGYQGDQDNDPINNTDCVTGSSRETEVRAAELEVFEFDASTRPPGDPVVTMTMKAPATAEPGDRISYRMTYTNLGPKPSAKAKITDVLPDGLNFLSASDGGQLVGTTGETVRWRLGTVPVSVTDSVILRATVGRDADVGDLILNQAQFSGALTFSPPAAAVTTVVEPLTGSNG
jgi:uncharacterized repeat protein (TIGR01451 family)